MRFSCLGLPLVFTLVSSCSSLNSQVNHHLYPFSPLLAPSFVRPLYLEHSSISLSVSVHCCQAVSPWGSALCCMEAFPGGDLLTVRIPGPHPWRSVFSRSRNAHALKGTWAIPLLVVHSHSVQREGNGMSFVCFDYSLVFGLPQSALHDLHWPVRSDSRCLTHQEVLVQVAWFYLG